MGAPACDASELLAAMGGASDAAAAAAGVCARVPGLHVRRLGVIEYAPVWEAMQNFTAGRDAHTCDEIWLLQHRPVYTLGQAGKPEHLLQEHGIPLVRIDRGGQITYHGPGQLVVYLLLDLARRRLKVRELVALLEQALIDCLADYGLGAQRRAGAPGVYIDDAKIAALGLRVRKGCSYHGLALNVDMDLTPFAWINPCGYEGLRTIQLADLGVAVGVDEAGERLLAHLERLLPPLAHPVHAPAEVCGKSVNRE